MNISKNFNLIYILLLLVVINIVSPIAIGNHSSIIIDVEHLNNLTSYQNYIDDLLKYNYNKEQFLRDYSDDKIISSESLIHIKYTKIISNSLMNSPWPMMCHDLLHTGRSPYNTINNTGFEKWRYSSGSGVNSGIVINDKGIIYYGDWGENIKALYPNGTLKWSYKTDNFISSTPVIAEDDTLYVGSWDHYLYAFNSSSGKLKWRFNAKGTIAGSLAIADNGTIYFGTMWDDATGHRIWAVNPDGTEKWQYKTGSDITSSPAIGDDGTIYIGSMDKYLYAMNPDGTLKWKYKTGDCVKGPPSIADDGTIYIGSYDDSLYALYPDNGTMIWKCKVGYGTETNPSIGSDGTIYVGGERLYAIYPNGTKRWTFKLGADRYIEDSCPAISADGTIYIGTHIGEAKGGEIIAINSNGTEKWRKQICYEWVDSSPSIAKDGTVYIGSVCEGFGYIHAFGPVKENSPPKSPIITGKKNGNVRMEYWYGFKTIDPDNNPIRLYIDWGDGSITNWTREHASNEIYYFEHTWTKSGNYMIQAKAKDNSGEEGPWGYLEVNMPRTKASTNTMWYQWLMLRFPMLEILLNLLK